MSITNDDSAAAAFDVEMALHGFECSNTPARAYVEVGGGATTLFAIVAGGEHGHWSFDFGLESSSIEITRAYEEGIRIDPEELPEWIGPIQTAIARRLTEVK